MNDKQASNAAHIGMLSCCFIVCCVLFIIYSVMLVQKLTRRSRHHAMLLCCCRQLSMKWASILLHHDIDIYCCLSIMTRFHAGLAVLLRCINNDNDDGNNY